jgi:hypothetical protein
MKPEDIARVAKGEVLGARTSPRRQTVRTCGVA